MANYSLRPRSTARMGRFPSWAAKRARSALNGGPRSSPTHYPDWSSLGDGPAGLIAELVLADDLADYIRLRAVCRPWRRCSPSPLSCSALDRRFHPRRWLMMAHDQRAAGSSPHHRRHFLNVSTGQCVQVDIPELRDHRLLIQPTAEGLLVLLGVGEAAAAVRVLNPLTRQVAELPPIAAGLLRSAEFTGTSPRDSAGLADDQTVLLYLCRIGTLAFAKPGDERWTLVKFNKLLMPTMSFAGRFYGVTSDAVMAVETTGGGSLPLPPRLAVAATLAKPFSRMADTVHMVDNGRELVLVRSRMREIPGAEEEDAEDCFRRALGVASAGGPCSSAVPVRFPCRLWRSRASALTQSTRGSISMRGLDMRELEPMISRMEALNTPTAARGVACCHVPGVSLIVCLLV